jgi:hypothetical protein
VVNESNLLFENLNAGTHICSVYKYSTEQEYATAAFFTPSLLHANIKCVYVSSKTSWDHLIEVFSRKGINAKEYIQKGQLLLFDNEKTYLTGNTINTENMLESIRRIENQAAKEGYSGVRFSGELPLISNNIIDEKNIVNYELAIDKYFQSSGSTSMCHYNETKYNADTLKKNYHDPFLYCDLWKFL